MEEKPMNEFEQRMAEKRFDLECAEQEHHRYMQAAQAAAEQHRRDGERARERELAEEEAAQVDAARVSAEEKAREERESAEQAALYLRGVSMGTRQAKALSTCIEALEALARDTTIDDAWQVESARDHVLRALRANFFEASPSPFQTMWETLEPMLPQLMAALGAAAVPASPVPGPLYGCVGQRVQDPAPGQAPYSYAGFAPGSVMSTPLGPMRVIRGNDGGLRLVSLEPLGSVKPASSPHFVAAPDGQVTPPSDRDEDGDEYPEDEGDPSSPLMQKLRDMWPTFRSAFNQRDLDEIAGMIVEESDRRDQI